MAICSRKVQRLGQAARLPRSRGPEPSGPADCLICFHQIAQEARDGNQSLYLD
jgi:hypothetical protein